MIEEAEVATGTIGIHKKMLFKPTNIESLIMTSLSNGSTELHSLRQPDTRRSYNTTNINRDIMSSEAIVISDLDN